MSFASHVIIFLVAVPLAVAPIISLLRVRHLPWLMACITSLFVFVLSIQLTQSVLDSGDVTYALGSWPAPYGIELRAGALTAMMTVIVSGVSTMALWFGRYGIYVEVGEQRAHYFYAAWMLVLAGLLGIAVTGDAFNVFVFMEISSLATYVLIAGGPDRRALTAVLKYLIMGTIGATFYLIGVGLVYMMTGTLNFADMEMRLADVENLRPVLVAAGFITVGLALKAAIFPLHVWMPNAYTYAPSAVAVFLSACSTKIALFILLKFDFFVFQKNLAGHDVQFSWFLMPLAAIAIIFGSAVAINENNIKRLLGYSSVAQLGYILMGASFVTYLGLSGGILHIFNHALIKATLFMAVACVFYRLRSAELKDFAGIAKKMPWTMAAFVLAGVALIGVPFTAGFTSKWLLVKAALEAGAVGYVLLAVVLIGSLMALVYIWKVVELAYFKPATVDLSRVSEAPLMMRVPLWIMVLMTLYFGVDPSYPVRLANAAAVSLLGHLS